MTPQPVQNDRAMTFGLAPDHAEILRWLRETDESRLASLWCAADLARRMHVGEAVHLRGLIEISNHCQRACLYCGVRRPNTAIRRYRMTRQEILSCVAQAADAGLGTVVLQAGEDDGIEAAWLAALIGAIKRTADVAVTLSLGERDDQELWLWRRAGADRYLLRFETSNRALYERIHPSRGGLRSDRIAMLRRLREMGYETGSGVMIGIPGQTYEDLAQDIGWFRRLGLDMIGVGPYLPHPQTPLGQGRGAPPAAGDEQVPNTALMTCKVIALSRLVCPQANIPSTTALATLDPRRGRALGLMRGANVIMPNLTPVAYRRLYDIYPHKTSFDEDGALSVERARAVVAEVGRAVGSGHGESPGWVRRRHPGAPALRGGAS